MEHKSDPDVRNLPIHPLTGDALLSRSLDVLTHTPAAVILDIDGTISEIAPTPESATVSDDIREQLTRLRDQLAIVAVITGRAAADGERLVGVDGLVYVGNHGLETKIGDQRTIHPSIGSAQAQITNALQDIETTLANEKRETGIIIENKELSGSIHYRLAPDPANIGAHILSLARAASENKHFQVSEGRMVVELRPRILVNKGTAIADLAQTFHLRSILFAGDDTTDLDGFREIKRLRENKKLDGLAIGVVAAESNPLIREEADGIVGSVPAMGLLLKQIATDLQNANPMDNVVEKGI